MLVKNAIKSQFNLIYVYTLLVCPFISNKRKNGWTGLVHIFCMTLYDLAWPQGKFMNDRIFKSLLLKKSIFENFEIPWNFLFKIHDIFCCFSMYIKITCLQVKQKMGAKRSISLVDLYYDNLMRKKCNNGNS